MQREILDAKAQLESRQAFPPDEQPICPVCGKEVRPRQHQVSNGFVHRTAHKRCFYPKSYKS